MSIADTDTKALARRLLAAYAGPPIGPIAGELPAGDIAAAYAVQLAQVATWEAGGRRPAGRKIGLTNPTVQRQLGVSEPDFGHLFADMIYGENELLPLARLHQPRVEAEVALMLGEDLDRPDISVLDVVRATEWVLPALEIVGSRIADWRIGIVDTVADNASSGLLVLGGPARPIAGIDLVRCPMTMTINGVVVSEGTGADCLGNPLNAAAWLARRSRDFGRPLRAGELILTGALGPMASLAPGDRVEAVIDGLGRVSTLVSTEPAESEKA